MATYKNIGLLFNKHYFKNINFSNIEHRDNEPKIAQNNQILFDTVFDASVQAIGGQQIELETTYPGLFLGSGYPHETGVLGELKLGFYFDHTTGLPVIPGSSVKGVLRSAFEVDVDKKGNNVTGDKSVEFIKDLLDETKERKTKLSNDDIDKFKNTLTIDKLKYLIKQIFGDQKTPGNDIFFDAYPIESNNNNGLFLSNDFITPHKDNPLKNPVPLQFLKILPQVTFRFDFKLTENEDMTAELKKELFKQILLDLGIGAKTNVGYGQFVLNKEENESRESYKKPSLAEIKQENAEKEANKTEAERRIVKGARLKCNVVEITNREVFFMFDWDKELKFTKKRMKLNVELKINNIIEIEIVEDFYVFRKVLFSNSVTIIQ